MCCPYFFPEQPGALAGNPRHTMLPLGGLWAGTCHAPFHEAAPPDLETQHHICILGYARGKCARFPSSDGPDAVRFTITDDDGTSLRLTFVAERDHHPYRHGPLEYSRAAHSLINPPPDQVFVRQAHAYIESYLRRKQESSPAGPSS